ncbi:MAG: DNA recombination protein RmuC [Actinomycetaceae bacterium]|nr:DNA recombination protein RmuC [Arcanobacterium sp.]MDD7505855.1 DNA recombination protein RmuC [Actinomycetaceae bacterium]MDY6143761.1 DNA recombination protein RmuC [Arcanobacterium sp.]
MTITVPILAILTLLILLVGWLGGYIYAQSRAHSTEAMLNRDLADAREKLLISTGRVEQLEQAHDDLLTQFQSDGTVLQALSPILNQLDKMTSHVQTLEQQTLAGTTKVLTQLSNDARVQAELSRTTASLNAALRSTSARGTWGEVQLRRIIEAAGMVEHVDFDVQKTMASISPRSDSTANRSRPDAVIHLPGGAHIAIDAKVPMDAYLRAQEIESRTYSSDDHLGAEGDTRIDASPGSDFGGAQTLSAGSHLEHGATASQPSLGASSESSLHTSSEPGDDYRNQEAKRALLGEHAKSLRGHVAALVKRNYPKDFAHSPQITVLFLPADSLLAEALSVDPNLLEDSFRQNVIPATPSTLFGLLRSIAVVWSNSAASEEAQGIVELGTTLVQRINIVVKHLNTLGKSLGNSVAAYNKAVASIESRLLVTARSFNSIPTDALDLAQPPYEIPSDHAQTNEFVSAELGQNSTEPRI